MTKTTTKPVATATGTGKAVKPVKEKRRNNEKRKEKSRDAARCRRSRETEIFQDLASLLPMRPEEVEHLDKASVMRLSIAFLKARNMLELFPELSQVEENIRIKEDNDVSMDSQDAFNEAKLSLKSLGLEPETIALQSLDGFLIILSADGDVTYISENVSEYLGISQIDIMGQPIWDYSHQCDHDELREALNGRHHSPSELLKGVANSDCRPMENRDFFLRLKCTLTSRGRSVNIKSASYKVLHVTGHIACKDKEEGQRQLVAIARPLPHPSNIEVPLGSSTFLTQHTLGMKFSYVDDIMLSLLGYQPTDLLGKSLYDCHHGSDAEHLMATFKHVISKGQSETSRYRFLAKTGGYAWVVTQATVIYDKQKPHSVVCVNYVLSGVENKDDILSCAQLEARQQLLSEQAEQCTELGNSSVVCGSDQQLSIEQCPAAATSLPSAVASSGDLEEVKAEETLSIPVPVPVPCVKPQQFIVDQVPIPVASGVGKVLLYVKNDTIEEEQEIVAGATLPAQPQRNRILRELNSIPAVSKPAQPPPTVTNRPVSVTASIFTSLPTGTSGSGSEKSCKQQQQQPAATIPSPQSVTAKLFVTLPPANGAAGGGPAGCNGVVSGGVSGAGSKPQHATQKIFAPRTEDMNKGFLMFSEEEPGLTMLKDEPDDLTHLAPTAGDACIPLEESGTFFNEMFEDFIAESYTLLQDELCSLDSQDTRLDTSSIGGAVVTQSGTIGIPVSSATSDSLTSGLPVSTSIAASSPLGGCTTSDGTDGVASLVPTANGGGNQTHQHNLSSTANACVPSPSSISVSSSPVPSSPSRSHLSSNPNSPSGTSGLGSSASSTVSTVDGHHHNVSIGGGSSSSGSSSSQHNASSNDPFINYRDEVNEVSPSPHLLSPGISKSPESSSLPSLCSPNGSLPEDELAFMSLNMDELDLSMRAPYISMSEVDDLPLLTSDDLLWGVPAATIEGGGPGTSISAFGLSGKFFIKDEYATLGNASSANGTENSSTTNNVSGTIESLPANNGNNDSKSALTTTTTTPPSIDSSLAALLCGGNVISIQSEPQQQQQQPINGQILIAHTNSASLNAATNQQQRHNNQQQQQHLQQQQRQQENVSHVKRIKLSEQNLVQQHSMVVVPTSVKLPDAWKFDDLLQLNVGAGGNGGKSTTQPQTNIIASFVATPSTTTTSTTSSTKKTSATTNAGGVNGNNKRTLHGGGVSDSATTASETGNACKRLKSGSGAAPSSAPQLLQQLMAPSPVPQKLKSKSRSSQDATGGGRWPNGQAGGAAGLLQEQSGNSVLMNLLVSGCDDTMPLTPPELLIGETVTEPSNDMPFNLIDDDDDGNGVLFSSINPLIGGQAPLNEAIARPLTIQTDGSSMLPTGTNATSRGQDTIRSGKLYGAATDTTTPQLANEFSMIVSPSLLTPTDMEIWRAIQQGQLDPKKIAPSAAYYGSAGGNIPKSLSGTPTAQLSADLFAGDPSDASGILAAFDAEAGSAGTTFRTIPTAEDVHQGLLI